MSGIHVSKISARIPKRSKAREKMKYHLTFHQGVRYSFEGVISSTETDWVDTLSNAGLLFYT